MNEFIHVQIPQLLNSFSQLRLGLQNLEAGQPLTQTISPSTTKAARPISPTIPPTSAQSPTQEITVKQTAQPRTEAQRITLSERSLSNLGFFIGLLFVAIGLSSGLTYAYFEFIVPLLKNREASTTSSLQTVLLIAGLSIPFFAIGGGVYFVEKLGALRHHLSSLSIS
ncbi:MAG: hypothetical protein D6780_05025, partial [Candidatus Dadabacteria bacterium]